MVAAAAGKREQRMGEGEGMAQCFIGQGCCGIEGKGAGHSGEILALALRERQRRWLAVWACAIGGGEKGKGREEEGKGRGR